jgi:hypothetical protein
MIRTAESMPRIAAELGSLIGMNQRASRPSSTHGHQHGVEHELSMNGGLGGPCHNQAGNKSMTTAT